jgi:molybdenum cofactor cytidylyltransferase
VLIAILGAGLSRRFGGNKLEAQCGNRPLGQWPLDAALATGFPVVWVGGARPASFIGTQCAFKTNPDCADGLGSSIAVAAREATARSASRLMLLLADMPHVTSGLLRELDACSGPAACRQVAGHPGPPALFPSSVFGRLAELSGDHGAASILLRMPDLVILSPALNFLEDVDTPEQLLKASQRLAARG